MSESKNSTRESRNGESKRNRNGDAASIGKLSDVPKYHPFLGTHLTVPSNDVGEVSRTAGHHQRGKRRRAADQRKVTWHSST